MKKIYFFLTIVMLSLSSCSTMTKDAYLEQYKSFIDEISSSSQNFKENDWKNADERFKKFDTEWYNDFKDEMSISEKGKTAFYNLQYVYYRNKENAKSIFDKYLNEDYEKLKKKIKYYQDNQMNDDLKKLEEFTKDAGDSAFSMFNKALKELK